MFGPAIFSFEQEKLIATLSSLQAKIVSGENSNPTEDRLSLGGETTLALLTSFFFGPERNSYLYLIEYRNRVKVGVTSRFEQRLKTINRIRGEENRRTFLLKLDKRIAFFAERTIKDHLNQRRHEGEFYAVEFDYARSLVHSFEDICIDFSDEAHMLIRWFMSRFPNSDFSSKYDEYIKERTRKTYDELFSSVNKFIRTASSEMMTKVNYSFRSQFNLPEIDDSDDSDDELYYDKSGDPLEELGNLVRLKNACQIEMITILYNELYKIVPELETKITLPCLVEFFQSQESVDALKKEIGMV
jgi:hypothetical protein